MKKKLFIGLILIITIIYFIVGALLFTDIQLLKVPETTITLHVLDINTNETLLLTTVDVKNPNSFDLITKDFHVLILTDTGREIGNATIAGDIVPPQKTKSFTATIPIRLQGESLNILRTKISGTVGMNLFGVLTKTLPLNLILVTDLNNSLERIQAPVIHVAVDLTDISEQGINITGTVDVTNPNSFTLFMDDFTATIRTDQGTTVGSVTISGGMVPAQQNTIFAGDGWIHLEALNAHLLTTTIATQASITIAGYEKSLDITADVEIIMPDLDDLLTSQEPLDLIILGDYRITPRGIIVNVELQIINPYNLTLIAKDLSVTIYQTKNEEKTEIGYGVIGDGIIPPKGNITLSSQIELPRHRLLFSLREMLFSDWMLTTVRGNFTIKGLDKTLWISISGYSDLHPFQ